METPITDMPYCACCGVKAVVIKIPEGDSVPRRVCESCHHIFYENPNIVTGAVCLYENKILMCKRAINPQKGLWTYPAGFLENGESVEEGAIREAYEEARARIAIDRLIGIYSILPIRQVHIIYLAHLQQPNFAVGEESLEVKFYAIEDIPWRQLAFPVIRWALQAYLKQVETQSNVVDSKIFVKALPEA